MANVQVTQAHAVTPEEARERLGDFGALLAKYRVALQWAGNRAAIKGTGVSGDVTIEPSRVVVSVKLGMLARAAGVDPKRLESSITRRLKAAFED